MQRYGKTAAGNERYYCIRCRISSTRSRADTISRHHYDHFVRWLTGKENLSELGKKYGITRRELSKEFQLFFRKNILEPTVSLSLQIHTLIIDAKYIHGNSLCVLIAVTEKDQIFFHFALQECHKTWNRFLSRFSAPVVVVGDGQKGIRSVIKRLWPDTAFQRCHFHVVSLVIQYLSRNPREEAGKEILHLLYGLKEIKTIEDRNRWITLFKIWEHQYIKVWGVKKDDKNYVTEKIRSVDIIIKRALPHLFTYLNYQNVPNTTNLVEGWVNTAIAEALRRHRGIRLHQKKTLVSIVLSNLSRRNLRKRPTRKFP